MSDVLSEVFRPYEEGQPAIFVSNRSLFDVVVDQDDRLRPLGEALRRHARAKHGMACITYSLAAGVDWAGAVDDERDRKSVEQALRAHGLVGIPQDEHELVRVLRGIASLARASTAGLTWSSGEPMRFAFVVMFTEHLTPGHQDGGSPPDAQLVASELAHITAQSLALRASGNYIIFHGDETRVDRLVFSALKHVRVQQPDFAEKRAFLEAALKVYDSARFDDGLSPDMVANLTANTPNRGLEGLLRASHRAGRRLTAGELSEQKARDVEQLSEGTLTLLNTDEVAGTELVGLNMSTPAAILARLSQGLLERNRLMPANVLLAGPPGTGKTQLAKKVARDGRVAAYEMHSPKGPYVGMTERLARQQQTLVKQWGPNLAFCDEITEAFPLERPEFDGDSGATRAVTAQLLSSLADETRRGRTLLLATTNCPWRIGAAMLTRFTVIPVLHPLERDLPAIIRVIAARLTAEPAKAMEERALIEAASVFHRKGASAREIHAALSNALLMRGCLDMDAIRFAAEDLSAAADAHAVIYSDYWAIRKCSSRSFLPWSADPPSYPFPPHLAGVVDQATGSINNEELDRRIAEMKPYAKL